MTALASGASIQSGQRQITLIELCEPLFQYICRLNRSARKGGNYELSQVQMDIKSMLAEARAKSVGANLSDQWDKIEFPLIFFCDFMIKESALSWAREWKELAFDRKEMAGDEKFFDILDETLTDKSPAANDRLLVFYTCMGLGFTGYYKGQFEYLRRKMKEIASRLQATGQYAESPRICPDAYERVDTRDLVEPPGTKLIGIAIALIGLMVVLFITYGYMYHESSQKLKDALNSISAKSKSVADSDSKEVGK